MSTESVKFLINARDNTGPATKKAESGFQRLKSSAMSVGAGIIGAQVLAKGMRMLTGAIKETIDAYIDMELVQTQLESSLEINGENVVKQLPLMNAWANELQRVLNVSDETANSLAILAQQQGMTADESRDGVEAAIGLSAALRGLSQEAALRGVANAMEGNFSALERHLPQLRAATTENEKMAIVMDAANKGLKIQADSTNTLGGSWQAFKNTVGDTMEQVGSLVGPTLTKMVKGFKFVLANWQDLLEVASLETTSFYMMIGGTAEHYLTNVIPSYFQWLLENSTAMLENAFGFYKSLFVNFVENARDSFKAVIDFMNNGFDFNKLSSDMGQIVGRNIVEGFTAEIGKLPEITDRVMSENERMMREKSKRLQEELLGSFMTDAIGGGAGEIPTAELNVNTKPLADELKLDLGLDSLTDKTPETKKVIGGVNSAVESRLLTRGTARNPDETTADNTKRLVDEAKNNNTTMKEMLGQIFNVLTTISKEKPQVIEAP